MPESRKRKRQSGLPGIEVTTAIDALKILAKKARQNMALDALKPLEEWDDEPDTAILEHIEGLLEVLQMRADTRFGQMARDLLEEMNIKHRGVLKLKDEAVDRGVKTDTLGNDTLWSATSVLAHLRFLEDLFPRRNEVLTRLKINASLYRVATMIPEDLKMALALNGVTLVSTRWTRAHSQWPAPMSVLLSQFSAAAFADWPVVQPNHTVFFVTDANDAHRGIKKYVPQALTEMFGFARRSGKQIVRGVVTDGGQWLFLVLTVQDDGTGTYLRSNEISNCELRTTRPGQEGVSLICAILAHWILHSHEAFNENTDFFERHK
ncbi:hypothetical protein BKA70DRAFT_1112960 [Coprinopsis sp. MPI-PUGE-AT-0042]|nr:hypothetical protein BKA70DRAFT_1112960 [Coprinopsis sp. MPI-PUGE-AT-0042]